MGTHGHFTTPVNSRFKALTMSPRRRIAMGYWFASSNQAWTGVKSSSEGFSEQARPYRDWSVRPDACHETSVGKGGGSGSLPFKLAFA